MVGMKASTARRYATAVIFVAAAVAFRLALDPIMGQKDILFAFTLAIVAAACLSGRGPALFATALSLPAALYFVIEPQFTWTMTDPSDIVALVLLGAIGVGASLFAKPVTERPAPPTGSNPRSRRRRLALIGGAGAALALLTSLLWSDFQREREREAWVRHTYQVLGALSGVMSNLDAAETAQRDFLLTGEQQYQYQFETAVQRARVALPGLQRLTADNPFQQEHLKELGAVVDAKVSLLRGAVAVKSERGAAAAVAMVAQGQGKSLMGRCAAILEAMEAEERRLLTARTQAAELQAKRMRWILGLGTTSLLLLLLLAGAAIERDLGQHRRADELSELLTSLVASSDDAIFSRDLDGYILSWNQGAERLTGYSASEVIGQALPSLFTGDRAEDYSQILERLRAGESGIQLEAKRDRKNGEAMELSVRISPLRLEGVLAGVSVIARDITEGR